MGLLKVTSTSYSKSRAGKGASEYDNTRDIQVITMLSFRSTT